MPSPHTYTIKQRRWNAQFYAGWWDVLRDGNRVNTFPMRHDAQACAEREAKKREAA